MRTSESGWKILYDFPGGIEGLGFSFQSILSHSPFLSKLSNSNENPDASKFMSSLFMLPDDSDVCEDVR